MKRTYIWGTGKIANYACCFCKDTLKENNIIGCIDNDKKKEGKLFWNFPIFTPSILENDKDCYIIILATAYEEINHQIMKNYPWLAERIESPLFITKHRLISRYKNICDPEILNVIEYLKKHSLQIFNYEFTSKYKKEKYDIQFDKKVGLYYTFFENKRMYFAKFLDTADKVENYYRQIMMEQDINSPHRYLTDIFQVTKNSVVIDAGVAEGNFALSIIDKVKKIYLFEPDLDWIEALNNTFYHYKDKVVIINKYLSNYTDENTVTLDDFIHEEKIDFIKLDIEGEEFYALEGAKNILNTSSKMKCVVCSYHQENDYIVLSQFFQNLGFTVNPSQGYMWFPYDKNYMYSLPTLRKGLIRAKKDDYKKKI